MASKLIILKSSDGETFQVEKAVAIQSQTLSHMIEDNCADTSIPLVNITGKTLAKVLEYCKRHADASNPSQDDELKNFDDEFVKVDQDTLFDLVLAANFLNIKSLLDLTCQAIADIMKGKTLEEIREMFNIENDLNPEEEEQIRRENDNQDLD